MNRLVAAAIGSLTLALATPAVARDEYAASYRQQVVQQWQHRIAAFEEDERLAYFAVGCHVVGEGAVINRSNYVTDLWLYRAASDGVFLAPRSDANARAGMARAKAEGCGFWQGNPQAVFLMRQWFAGW
jgi:hypothetical protein